MDIQKIIQTVKMLKAFIGETVLDEEELQSDKRKRRRVGWLSILLTIILLSEFPTYAYERLKTIVMAPPPRSQEAGTEDGRWVEFLERRITVSLDKVEQLEALLRKAQSDLKLSESARKSLEARIKELTADLNALRTLGAPKSGGSLYDRLNKSKGR